MGEGNELGEKKNKRSTAAIFPLRPAMRPELITTASFFHDPFYVYLTLYNISADGELQIFISK